LTKRLYDSVTWRRMRERQLAKHPLCSMCLSRGLTVQATVADHIIPHHEDRKLFFDPTNLQSLCPQCHDSRKRMIEKHGYSQACDAEGLPIDISHPWYQEKVERSKKRREDKKHDRGKSNRK